MNISLDGHHGQQCREDYTVYFYGLYFEDIVEASKYLKGVPKTHDDYRGKYFKSYKVICDRKSDLVYHKGYSFIDMNHFNQFVKVNCGT